MASETSNRTGVPCPVSKETGTVGQSRTSHAGHLSRGSWDRYSQSDALTGDRLTHGGLTLLSLNARAFPEPRRTSRPVQICDSDSVLDASFLIMITIFVGLGY